MHVVIPVTPPNPEVISMFKVETNLLPSNSKKMVLFNRYCQTPETAKDHKRLRRAGIGSKDFSLTPTIPSHTEKQS